VVKMAREVVVAWLQGGYFHRTSLLDVFTVSTITAIRVNDLFQHVMCVNFNGAVVAGATVGVGWCIRMLLMLDCTSAVVVVCSAHHRIDKQADCVATLRLLDSFKVCAFGKGCA
jgi:hypothetical protein